MMNTNGDSSGRLGYAIALVIVLLVLGVGIASFLYGPPSPSNSSASSSAAESTTTPTSSTTPSGNQNVTVFGLVGTTGAGTQPVSLTFTSLRSSTKFVATISSGRFFIQLPNQDSYNASLRWIGNFSWQQGQVPAGSLSLNKTSGSNLGQSFNLVLPTPDSLIAVNGTVPWQVVTSNPVSVRFTATDGENFTAPVSAGHTFSTHLPNMMNYQVHIQSQNSTGYQEWYYAHSLQVEAGVNVVGLLVRLPL